MGDVGAQGSWDGWVLRGEARERQRGLITWRGPGLAGGAPFLPESPFVHMKCLQHLPPFVRGQVRWLHLLDLLQAVWIPGWGAGPQPPDDDLWDQKNGPPLSPCHEGLW